MASQARVWCYQTKSYVIAFKKKFNQIVLSAMKSNDPVTRRDGFDLFSRGLRKIFRPTAAAAQPAQSKPQSTCEAVYSCIFVPLHVMTKQRFKRLIELGATSTDTITATQLAEFSSLVPQTRAAMEEMYDHRFERNEELLASLLRAVLHLYDPEAWPILDSLPPICSFRYSKGAGLTMRTGAGLKFNLDQWNSALHRCDHCNSRSSLHRSTSEWLYHSKSDGAAQSNRTTALDVDTGTITDSSTSTPRPSVSESDPVQLACCDT